MTHKLTITGLNAAESTQLIQLLADRGLLHAGVTLDHMLNSDGEWVDLAEIKETAVPQMNIVGVTDRIRTADSGTKIVIIADTLVDAENYIDQIIARLAEEFLVKATWRVTGKHAFQTNGHVSVSAHTSATSRGIAADIVMLRPTAAARHASVLEDAHRITAASENSYIYWAV